METGANTVLALNMLNYAEEAGFKIDVKKLQKVTSLIKNNETIIYNTYNDKILFKGLYSPYADK